jgi:hypothetical protein
MSHFMWSGRHSRECQRRPCQRRKAGRGPGGCENVRCRNDIDIAVSSSYELSTEEASAVFISWLLVEVKGKVAELLVEVADSPRSVVVKE